MQQTELSVVNALLEVIEDTALQTVDRNHPDVVFALNTWEEQSIAIQSQGWWYNTEQYQLVPDARSGEVFLPGNVLSIDLKGLDYVKRGRRLYNLKDHTYVFSTDTPAEDLLVDCIMEWSMGELPPSVFRLVLMNAKIIMVMNRQQDQVKLQILSMERDQALVTVQKENLAYLDTSVLETTRFQVFQSTQPRRY